MTTGGRPPLLTCVASVHVHSVAVVLAPAPHDVVHEVRFGHVHGWVHLHLPEETNAVNPG